MKLTRHQKMYVSILAVALAALAIDRLVLSSGSTDPAPAVAASPSPVTAAAPQPAPAPSERTSAIAAPEVSLVDRLKTLERSPEASLENMRDAMRLAPEWSGADTSPTGSPRQSPAERFANEHRLLAVAISGPVGTVVVDETCLGVGDSIDGFRLVSVDERTARFERAGQSVVLELQDSP